MSLTEVELIGAGGVFLQANRRSSEESSTGEVTYRFRGVELSDEIPAAHVTFVASAAGTVVVEVINERRGGHGENETFTREVSASEVGTTLRIRSIAEYVKAVELPDGTLDFSPAHVFDVKVTMS
ncbi:hypothetical protein [Nocardia sp. NBC_01327]|uniref:hypothetical protein n=1 Tax=Nocardia sp. NBC_01327 TaxID=2903593 RepID=UPI002E0EEE93|nr:hypothetical protein OG326_21005 [Nocardia sp. NBC_01327]